MESLFGITGSKVLLTGGTGGIGSALVGGFLRAGAHVCMLARDEDAVKISQQKYSEFGGNSPWSCRPPARRTMRPQQAG